MAFTQVIPGFSIQPTANGHFQIYHDGVYTYGVTLSELESTPTIPNALYPNQVSWSDGVNILNMTADEWSSFLAAVPQTLNQLSAEAATAQTTAPDTTAANTPADATDNTETSIAPEYGDNPPDISVEEDPELALENQPEDEYSDLSSPEDITAEDDPELALENQPEDEYSDLDAPPDIDDEEDPALNQPNNEPEGPPISKPPTLPLPMGNDIQDIDDPNLTPEQVASLSPGDQRARADYLGYPYTGPGNAATVNPDGSLTVNAPSGLKAGTKAQATLQDQSNHPAANDWRVMLKLAPGSNYLYNAPNPGILGPLSSKGGTDGVVFPYTPGINITYSADYQPETLVHSNYTINQYKSSHVDAITITAEFTAQDVFEANYLLAVIHFFKSATKMFYGQDSNPKNGTPPPLCYLFGYGGWQFENHPLAIQQFSYNLPPDVDYIQTRGPSAAGTAQPTVKNNTTNGGTGPSSRLPPNINPGGTAPPPNFPNTPASANVPNTWVPTKIQMLITCVPIISRNNISNIFSLKDYAAGSLTPAVNKSVNTGFW